MKEKKLALLRALMEQYSLRRSDLCRMLGLTVRKSSGSTGTIDDWLSKRSEIPISKLELLSLKAPTYVKPEAGR